VTPETGRQETDCRDNLAIHLQALNLNGLPSVAITREIIGEIRRWADAKGWRCESEVDSGVARRGGPGKTWQHYKGYVDLVVHRGQLPPIAIEVDRADKKWSLVKLGKCASDGMEAIWVRWGYPCLLGIPRNILLIRVEIAGWGRRKMQRHAKK
jgi:hypothetical protein